MRFNRLTEIDNELRILGWELKNRYSNDKPSFWGTGLGDFSQYAKYLRRERRRLHAERNRLLAA